MPLRKDKGLDRSRTKGNLFESWWKRGDAAWRAERLQRWPEVSRSLHRYLSDAGSQMADFERYFLEGTPFPGLRGYLPLTLRLAMIPFESADEARQAIEANTSPSERVLRRELRPSLLRGASIQLECLPTARHDDAGIRKLIQLGDAAFPEAFTAADAESSDADDPHYFLEHGRGSASKPLPFIVDYQRLATKFVRQKVTRGQRVLVNPSDHVRAYYLSCVRYIEDTGGDFDPEDDGGFQTSLTAFLTEILFFDDLNPAIDPGYAAAHFAHGWRACLDREDLPSVMAEARDRLLGDPPILRPRPAQSAEGRFGHLAFIPGTTSQYRQAHSPDADSYVVAIARFAETPQRDAFARMLGEPGRPANRSAVAPNQQPLFDAIRVLPLPFGVLHAGETAVYVEFVDWHYAHASVRPLLDALAAAEPELAYVTFSMIEEDGVSGHFEIRGGQVSAIEAPPDPSEQGGALWQTMLRLSEET